MIRRPRSLRAPPALVRFFLSVCLAVGGGALVVSACSDSSEATGPLGPATLAVVEGDGARAPAGTVVPLGPTVEVKNAQGDPLAGVEVHFSVVNGGGQVADGTVTTDARGRARGVWILGRGSGVVQRIRASAEDLSVDLQAEAFAPVLGQSYQGRKGYSEYLPGSLPLVISAPHGGEFEPVEIPNRGWGATAQDRNTLDLALRIREAIWERTGAYPHVVLSRLHRIKLDPNREIVEAAQGNWEAERAWWEYHTFADEAGALVEDAFGHGLYLDIHGHAHEIDRLELGYLLSSADLSNDDTTLSSSPFVNKSSVGALVGTSGIDLAGLVRGPFSLGSLLEERGVPAVPSQTQPDPAGAAYFSGGYSTARHGSRDGGSISGIQIEHHYPGLRDEVWNRQEYANILADALLEYFPTHFGMDLTPLPPEQHRSPHR
ncbi:hypothetical protein ACFL3S_12000 [Gemmatimonadota bacterium]